MDISNSCRCCLLRPSDKKMKKPYVRSGKTEIYSNMLKECFEIHLNFLPKDDECGICGTCVTRLREACDFKLQVQRSQEELQAWLNGGCHIKEEGDLPKTKTEKTDDNDTVREEVLHATVEVKAEVLVDPLPTGEEEEFKIFMTDLENQASNDGKQEPMFEVPLDEQTECPYILPPMVFDHDSKHNIKPKKERKFGACGEKNATYSCDTCGRQFTRKVGLNIHKQIHNRGPFVCEICKKQFKWKSRLDTHTQIHTGDKPFLCEKCHKRFSDRYSLNKHIQTHTGEKPYACDICNARYTQKQNLISHMGLHTGIKHFRCRLCPVKFTDNNSLRRHIRKDHTSPHYFICDECKRVFRFKEELIRHMNVHFRWTTYTCDICGLNLSTKNSLRRHRMVHTGERAHFCQMCNKQFRHKHSLNAHILTHTGEKPHCCEICGKQFAQKTNLKTHLEIHVEGQIFACELCTKSYSTSEGLRQHRRTHRKNKSQTKSVSKRQKQKNIN